MNGRYCEISWILPHTKVITFLELPREKKNFTIRYLWGMPQRDPYSDNDRIDFQLFWDIAIIKTIL